MPVPLSVCPVAPATIKLKEVDLKMLRNVLLEYNRLVVLVVGVAAVSGFVSGFEFSAEGEFIRLSALSLSVLPLVAAYGALRLLLPSWWGVLVCLAGYFTLAQISEIKLAHTGLPLTAADILGFENYSIVLHYAGISGLLGLTAIALSLVSILIARSASISRGNLARFIGKAVVAIAVICSIFHPAVSSHFLSAVGATYYSWDWPQNIRKNGLAFHLMQTGIRNVPDRPTDEQIEAYKSMGAPIANADRPRSIAFILCESCWHDGNHFMRAFEPLKRLGMQPMRAQSPIYGGGTINTAFEMLTALPSRNNVMTGMLYQEYADLFSKEADTLPSRLKGLGYKTLAMHNNSTTFWRRDVVMPKFGFDAFYGLKDMEPEGHRLTAWADDKILFNLADDFIEADDKPVFLHLTTIYTHGTYKGDDGGVLDYESRLIKTIDRTRSFVDKMLSVDPNALIIVYGDHKPALNKFFYEEGILGPNAFEVTGERNSDFKLSADMPSEILGDVPFYIYHKDNTRVQKFMKQASGKPFFCIAAMLDDAFLRTALPAASLSAKECGIHGDEPYETIAKSIPDWIYPAALLKLENL